jgi:hypothetical protein
LVPAFCWGALVCPLPLAPPRTPSHLSFLLCRVCKWLWFPFACGQAPHVLDLPALASQCFGLSRLDCVAMHPDIGTLCAALDRVCLTLPVEDVETK